MRRVSFLAFFLFFVTKYKLLIQADYSYTNSPDVTFLVKEHKTALFQILVVALLILSELCELIYDYFIIFFVIFSTVRIKTHLP